MNFSASCDYSGDDSRIIQHSLITQHIGKLKFGAEDTVLDVGCGTGNETKSIAAKVRGITGIDLSEEMLAEARVNNSAPNITYCLGDAQTVGDNPKWREKFDKVVCFSVLHWVSDKPKALRSILNCLKPGGEALLITGNRESLFSEATMFLNGHTKWGDYVKGYTFPAICLNQSVAETKAMMKAFGWIKCECENVKDDNCLSEKQAKLFFKTVLGQTARIPKAEQDEYLDDLYNWALSRHFLYKSQPGLFCSGIEISIIHAFKP